MTRLLVGLADNRSRMQYWTARVLLSLCWVHHSHLLRGQTPHQHGAMFLPHIAVASPHPQHCAYAHLDERWHCLCTCPHSCFLCTHSSLLWIRIPQLTLKSHFMLKPTGQRCPSLTGLGGPQYCDQPGFISFKSDRVLKYNEPRHELRPRQEPRVTYFVSSAAVLVPV